MGSGFGDYSEIDRMVFSWRMIQWPKFEMFNCSELRVNPNWCPNERASLR